MDLGVGLAVPWGQPGPAGQLSGAGEAVHVADLGTEHCCEHRPNPGMVCTAAWPGSARGRVWVSLVARVISNSSPSITRRQDSTFARIATGSATRSTSSVPATSVLRSRPRPARRTPGTSDWCAARPVSPGDAPTPAALASPAARSKPPAVGPYAASRPGLRHRPRHCSPADKRTRAGQLRASRAFRAVAGSARPSLLARALVRHRGQARPRAGRRGRSLHNPRATTFDPRHT
jgi:hypothetical protein